MNTNKWTLARLGGLLMLLPSPVGILYADPEAIEQFAPQYLSGDVLFKPSELEACIEIDGVRECTKEVDLGDGVARIAHLSISPKANGLLRVLNLSIKVYDCHDDAVVFHDCRLDVVLSDVTSDGCLDLVIAGSEIIYGDDPAGGKATVIIDRREILMVYRFDEAESRFVGLVYVGDPENEFES